MKPRSEEQSTAALSFPFIRRAERRGPGRGGQNTTAGQLATVESSYSGLVPWLNLGRLVLGCIEADLYKKAFLNTNTSTPNSVLSVYFSCTLEKKLLNC